MGLPQIQIHSLPLAAASQVNDLLAIDRQTAPGSGVYTAYRLPLGNIDLTVFPYSNASVPGVTSVGGALDKALVPTVINALVTKTGPYGSGDTNYQVTAQYDIVTLHLQMRDTALPVELVSTGAPPQKPTIVRILADGDSSDGSYSGVSKVQIVDDTKFFWVADTPNNGTQGQLSIAKGASAVVIFQYLGNYGLVQGFYDWLATYTAPQASNVPLSGSVDPEGVVTASAGSTYVNTATGGFFWKMTDGTAIGWKP